eukprot:TRINITY_DN9352_c0_g1_i1.p1 TRINITY_DN9352_c0_g1~~TRINITY_DN9352_c0_g1_i1.p1  ORF type:complete len:303 (-),score=42.52 TRINITY_DN9352_c0_g1_i1:482-1390(-)
MVVFLSIAVNRLGVPRQDLESVKKFYTDILGMDVEGNVACFGRARLNCQGSMAIEFLPSDGPDHRGADAYWKIGLGLPDVNAAVKVLNKKGIDVAPGAQFRRGGCEVGFLTHMTDNVGYTIELLQDTFEQNFKPVPAVDAPLACLAPKVGQLTLRVSDIGRSLEFYRDTLGMKLLCWYDVGGMFSLYFLAFTEDASPDSDPTAQVNREWTYSRPYTTLELQVAPGGKGGPTCTAAPGSIGWQGMVVGVSDLDAAKSCLASRGLATAAGLPYASGSDLEVKDPDGYNIWLRPAGVHGAATSGG